MRFHIKCKTIELWGKGTLELQVLCVCVDEKIRMMQINPHYIRFWMHTLEQF